MSQGRKISLAYSTGLSTGLLFWGVVAVSGMGVVLQNSVYLLMLLKILGGLYLLWLSYQSAKSCLYTTEDLSEKHEEDVSYGKWFLKGIILNCSNPKSVIVWMSALSIGVGKDDDWFTLLFALMVCVIIGFVVNGTYSILFSIKHIAKAYRKGRRWIDGFVSGFFALAGIGLIRSAVNRT